jgi:hypothetical protein
MSDVFKDRSERGGGKAAGGESTHQEPPRIRIDVAMGTSYYEIQESIFRQAWQLAGSQLRAAIALGITPETISRFLRRCDRERMGRPRVPEVWPVVAPVHRALEPSTDPVIGRSGDRVNSRENQSPMARTASSVNEESDSFSTHGYQQEPTSDD